MEELDRFAEEMGTFVDLLRWRATQPHRRAYTFLTDGETQEAAVTYGQLHDAACSVAAALAEVAQPGDRALLLYPPGLDFIAAFFGCLYAGVIAVPAYPPHRSRKDRTLPRLRAICSSAQPVAALTHSSTLPAVEQLAAAGEGFESLRCVATDLPLQISGAVELPSIDPSTLAFLQYTSGSTGTPKGVMVSHGNLIHNSRMIERAFDQSAESVIAGWLPFYHDMGLIGNVLQPLWLGAHCILMSPVAVLQRPLRWLEAISRYRVNCSGGPNFIYELCADKVTPEQLASLDLSSWKLAFNGAEPVRHATLARFAETFAVCGFSPQAFYPCFGLAEGTLLVTGASSKRCR